MAPFDVFLIGGGVFLLLGLFRRDGARKTARVERRGVEASERRTFVLLIVLGSVLLAVALLLFALGHTAARF